MEFGPTNPIVKLFLQGMEMEGKDQFEEAAKLFFQAWNDATNDFEKFLAAHFIARQQNQLSDKLKWLETALEFALKVNDEAVQAAFPPLYNLIAACYDEQNEPDKAEKHRALANNFSDAPTDKGPFYHGTKAHLGVGDMLTAGGRSNYKSEVIMNHIYFTALMSGAGLAASLAKGEGRERVYIVEPTGNFENDPNVTNKKFPGNPTCSYRSLDPLKIVGEVPDWARQTPGDLEKWKQKLAKNKGEIIN